MDNSVFNQQSGVFPEYQQVVHHNAGCSNGQTVSPVKGAWTPLEDSALEEMVKAHGERNWVVVATGVKGRTGKQCRERWINNLRPGIKDKNKWTEKKDKWLIQAHKIYGNSWKAIGNCLGRSENSVKNHWNATKRSLASRCYTKKKKRQQVPFGQFTVLEDYIGSLPMTSQPERLGSDPGHQQQAFPNTFVEPLVSNPHALDMSMDARIEMPPQMMQGGMEHPNAFFATTSFNPPDMGMYSNATTFAEIQAMQSQATFCPHTFTDHPNYPVQQNIKNYTDPQGTYANVNDPLFENVMWESYQTNSDWFNNELGGSNAGGNAVPFSENVARQPPNQGNSNGCSRQVGETSAANNIVSLSENAVQQSSNLGNTNGFSNECASSAGGNTLPFDIDDVQMASILNWFTPFEDDDALDFDKFV